MRVYIAGGGGSYMSTYEELGQLSARFEEFSEDPTKFDLVAFTGGEDISPSLYFHRNLASSYSTQRDNFEHLVFAIAKRAGVPMAGVCRGMQLLNVLMGGTMVQNLGKSHGGFHHKIITRDGEEIISTSAHHQMCVMARGGVPLAWAEHTMPAELMTYDGGPRVLKYQVSRYGGVASNGEVRVLEALAYPKAKIFGVQGHPEWVDKSSDFHKWYIRMIKEFCFNEKEEPKQEVASGS